MLFRKRLSSLTVREIAEINTCKFGRAGKHMQVPSAGKIAIGLNFSSDWPQHDATILIG